MDAPVSQRGTVSQSVIALLREVVDQVRGGHSVKYPQIAWWGCLGVRRCHGAKVFDNGSDGFRRGGGTTGFSVMRDLGAKIFVFRSGINV